MTNTTALTTATTATLTLSTSAISFPTSVPSGYARQALAETNRTHAFRTYNIFGA